ncbi:hypothetical protein GCM10018771_05280 [Streptomyces cellulosae]|nr:hypothetical protein GCM10018771_05280 [Streptomyces cellulosae]
MATRSACRIWTDAPEAGVEGPHMSGSSPECLAIEGLSGFSVSQVTTPLRFPHSDADGGSSRNGPCSLAE